MAAGIELLLGDVAGLGLGEQVRRLGDRREALLARVGADLGAVDRDRAEADETRTLAEAQHLREQADKRVGVSAPKSRDGDVVGRQTRGDDPEGDVLAAAPLDHPRGAFTARVGVEQQRRHNRRVIGRPPLPSAR